MIRVFKFNYSPLRISIIFIIFASLAFASGSIIAKILGSNILGEGVNPLQIAHARFTFAFLILLPIAVFFKINFKFQFFKIHLLRSFLGLLGIIIWFTAILNIPISDATAINFLNPIFAMLFAIYFLKEKVGIIRWSGAIFSFLGGLLLIRPNLNFDFNPYALLCIFGAISMGFEIICIKYLSNKEDLFIILFINNAIASLICSLSLPFIFKMPNINELLTLIAVAVCFLLGQIFFLNSMKRADASFVMPFFYSTLIFVVILDFLIFSYIPDWVSFLGCFIIIVGALIVSLKDRENNY